MPSQNRLLEVNFIIHCRAWVAFVSLYLCFYIYVSITFITALFKLISQLMKGSKEKLFIKQIFNENIRRLHQGKSFSAKKNAFFCRKTFALMKTSDIFVKNLFNKKLLLAAFHQLTYQHDSKDFNICNYKIIQIAFRWPCCAACLTQTCFSSAVLFTGTVACTSSRSS